MVSERIYELCKPILEDVELGEEEKTDKLEDLLSSEPSSLKGRALEDAVLGALWQWKSATDKKSSPHPALRRHRFFPPQALVRSHQRLRALDHRPPLLSPLHDHLHDCL